MPTFNDISITIPDTILPDVIAVLARYKINTGTPQQKLRAYLRIKLLDDIEQLKRDVAEQAASNEIETYMDGVDIT